MEVRPLEQDRASIVLYSVVSVARRGKILNWSVMVAYLSPFPPQTRTPYHLLWWVPMRQDTALGEGSISAVQEYNITYMYDSIHALYHDGMRRANAWTETGETLNKSGRLIIIMQ
jgi:hypothetical protein